MQNIAGKIYNRWEVLEDNGKYCVAICECGTKNKILKQNLIYNKSKSCGCLQREIIGTMRTTHAMNDTPEYNLYYNTKKKCKRDNIDFAFNTFEEFLNEVKSVPEGDYFLERIDKSLGYCSGNLKFITRKEHFKDKRSNVYVTYKGKTQTMKAWSQELNMDYNLIKSRFYWDWTPEEVFETPKREYTKLT